MDSYSMISHTLYYNMYNKYNKETQLSKMIDKTIHGTQILTCYVPLVKRNTRRWNE